jgi:outer membrane protein assembly factor BamB
MLALVVAVSGCAAPDFMARGQKTPDELTGIDDDIDLRRLWSVHLGSGNRYADHALVPAVADGRIYVSDWDGDVFAVDAKRGRIQWRSDVGRPISAGPSVAGGVVVWLELFGEGPLDPDAGPPSLFR